MEDAQLLVLMMVMLMVMLVIVMAKGPSDIEVGGIRTGWPA
jgi:hypothetical protein